MCFLTLGGFFFNGRDPNVSLQLAVIVKALLLMGILLGDWLNTNLMDYSDG